MSKTPDNPKPDKTPVYLVRNPSEFSTKVHFPEPEPGTMTLNDRYVALTYIYRSLFGAYTTRGRMKRAPGGATPQTTTMTFWHWHEDTGGTYYSFCEVTGNDPRKLVVETLPAPTAGVIEYCTLLELFNFEVACKLQQRARLLAARQFFPIVCPDKGIRSAPEADWSALATLTETFWKA